MSFSIFLHFLHHILEGTIILYFQISILIQSQIQLGLLSILYMPQSWMLIG